MKFIVDECCEVELVKKLREEGHDVVYVMEISPADTDKMVLEKSLEENRILITEDTDFGGLVFRLKMKAYGIILLRFKVSERKSKWRQLNKLIELKADKLKGRFVVADKTKIRITNLERE